MLNKRVLASLVFFALILPCVGAAQGAVTAAASGTASFDNPLSCGPFSATGAAASVSITQCVTDQSVGKRYTGFDSRGTMGDASATAGVASVNLSAEVHQFGAISYGVDGNVNVSGTSTWNDVLSWNNANVASVGVRYGVTGSAYQAEQVDNTYFTGLDNSASSVVGLTYGSGSVVGSESWNGFTHEDINQLLGSYQPGLYSAYYANTNDLISTNVYQEYDVTGSSLPLFWSVYMSGNAQVGRILSGEVDDAFALGRLSGGIASLQFFDANHVDITNQVQYEFANGASIEFSSTPEPATFALLGTGLIGLVPLARRKQRERERRRAS